MASTQEVERLPDERCPECGSGFAKDLAGRGFRRHLKKLPKRDASKKKKIILDDEGNPVMCGGTKRSWGKGGRS
jgi:hypothetical protein